MRGGRNHEVEFEFEFVFVFGCSIIGPRLLVRVLKDNHHANVMVRRNCLRYAATPVVYKISFISVKPRMSLQKSVEIVMGILLFSIRLGAIFDSFPFPT